MRGHKRGCRCVGCSPATRAKGMRALVLTNRKRSKPARRLPSGTARFIARHVKHHIEDLGMGPAEAFGAAYREARKKGLRVPKIARPNPPALRVVGVVPGHLEEMRYRRTGKRPGPYKHIFGRGVRILCLSDGSVLIRGRRPVWAKE